MPIAIKDYTWTETLTEVQISVPLKTVKASKVDIFSTDDYIKVSFPPFVCELFLHKSVDDDKSVAKIGDGIIKFLLVKKEPELWTRLCLNDASNNAVKEAKQKIRDDAIKKAQEKAELKEKEKAKEKQEQAKKALQEQMKLERDERKRIEDIKATEIKTASDEIEKWKEDQEKGVDSDNGGVEEDEPAPRTRGEIKISFTERVFPTPLRESKVDEEQAWLKKQAEARKRETIDDPDLSMEEKDPVWLKEKGDGFYKNGNFLSAVNAYTLAIRINPKLPSLYSNRSACHLNLNNFMKCIEDASKALELLTPPVAANAQARMRGHVRRGTAFCNLELYCEGLLDYEAASKIAPDNKDLQEDIMRIRKVIQGELPP